MKNMFKTMLLTVALAFAFASVQPAHAQYGGSAARVAFGATNVGTSTYVVVNSGLTRSIKGIYVANSAPVAFLLGIAASGATANTETQVGVIPMSQSAGNFIPLNVSAGYRISIKAYTSTASAGFGDFNFIYN